MPENVLHPILQGMPIKMIADVKFTICFRVDERTKGRLEKATMVRACTIRKEIGGFIADVSGAALHL